MHYQVIYLVEHRVVLVVLEIILNKHNKIHELIVVVVRRQMDEVVQEAEVDAIVLMDQIVAIIIIIITQMKMVRMEILVMKHLYHHPHGLVVVIIHVVAHLVIEYDLMMIGESIKYITLIMIYVLVLIYLEINLKHFVVVVVVVVLHVKHRKVGVDHEVMMMIIMKKMKIHRHQSMVQLHGHLEVDKQDVVVAVVQ
jgi:hypothetical protein